MACFHPSSPPAADPLQRAMTEATVAGGQQEAQP